MTVSAFLDWQLDHLPVAISPQPAGLVVRAWHARLQDWPADRAALRRAQDASDAMTVLAVHHLDAELACSGDDSLTEAAWIALAVVSIDRAVAGLCLGKLLARGPRLTEARLRLTARQHDRAAFLRQLRGALQLTGRIADPAEVAALISLWRCDSTRPLAQRGLLVPYYAALARGAAKT